MQTRFLLTGVLKCAICGGNFAARVVRTQRGGGRYIYYGCGFRARRGTSVCQNATLLPQDAIERELLELLLQAVFTPATLERVLATVNARLCAQAQVSRPRVKELRRALRLGATPPAPSPFSTTAVVTGSDVSSVRPHLREASLGSLGLTTPDSP